MEDEDDDEDEEGGGGTMDVDVDSVETELNTYVRVQQVPLDTDPLMWWTYNSSLTWSTCPDST